MCTDLLVFTLKLRKTSARRLSMSKWGLLPANEVGKISQHTRRGEGGKEGIDEAGHF